MHQLSLLATPVSYLSALFPKPCTPYIAQLYLLCKSCFPQSFQSYSASSVSFMCFILCHHIRVLSFYALVPLGPFSNLFCLSSNFSKSLILYSCTHTVINILRSHIFLLLIFVLDALPSEPNWLFIKVLFLLYVYAHPFALFHILNVCVHMYEASSPFLHIAFLSSCNLFTFLFHYLGGSVVQW